VLPAENSRKPWGTSVVTWVVLGVLVLLIVLALSTRFLK
jgi:hypothetical protein